LKQIRELVFGKKLNFTKINSLKFYYIQENRMLECLFKVQINSELLE
jgi:hypothetical protein